MFKMISPADRIGLDRIEAAEYIGVGKGLFDAMVADGRMPKPKAINARRVWSRLALERAFAALPDDGLEEDAATNRSKVFFRDMPLKYVSPDVIRKLRDRKKNFPNAADDRLKVLRVMVAWGMLERPERVKANPAKQVHALEVKSAGYHTWTEQEAAQFEANFPIGAMPRLAFDILQYTGARRLDAVLLGLKHLVEVLDKTTKAVETWLVSKPMKTARSTGQEIKMPLLPALRESLAATSHGTKTFLVTHFASLSRQPVSATGFATAAMRQDCHTAPLTGCASSTR